MSTDTGHRTADKLNTIGIVVIGVVGAVLTYVSIVLLQTFYVNDSAEVQTMADYGGQDKTAKSMRSNQLSTINTAAKNGDRYIIPIAKAMDLVVAGARTDASKLVPALGVSDKPSVHPKFGRPVGLDKAAPAGVVVPVAPVAPVAPGVPPADGAAVPATATPAAVVPAAATPAVVPATATPAPGLTPEAALGAASRNQPVPPLPAGGNGR